MASHPQPCLPIILPPATHKNETEAADDNSNATDFDFINHHHLFANIDIATLTANEYLRRVSIQASRLPHIKTATIETTASSTATDTKKQNPQQCSRKDVHSEAVDGCAAALQVLVRSHQHPHHPHHHQQQQQKQQSCSPADEFLFFFLPARPSAWTHVAVLEPFARLRAYLSRLDDQLHQTTQTIQTQTQQGTRNFNRNRNRTRKHRRTRSIPVPAMSDRIGWNVFCVGRLEAETILIVKDEMKMSMEDCDDYYDYSDDPQDTELPRLHHDDNDNTHKKKQNQKRKNIQGYDNNDIEDDDDDDHDEGAEPTVPLVLQLDQVLTRRVLAHLVYALDEKEVQQQQQSTFNSSLLWLPSQRYCQWLYALLARLEKPLHRDDAVTLYSLLKLLLRVRKQRYHAALSSTAMPAATTTATATATATTTTSTTSITDDPLLGLFIARINVLIAIVSVYFEQGGFQRVMTVNDHHN